MGKGGNRGVALPGESHVSSAVWEAKEVVEGECFCSLPLEALGGATKERQYISFLQLSCTVVNTQVYMHASNPHSTNGELWYPYRIGSGVSK